MNFTLDQLRAIDAIDRLGSFAAAAKELHRVPSAITYLVQNLESGLDLTLFERSKRSARLTAEGRRVLQESRAVLERARSLESLALSLAGGWEGTLQVVVDGAIPMGPVSACIAALSRPDVPTTLRVDIEYQEGVLDRIERDGADVGLYLGFDTEAEAVNYESAPLTPLEFVLVAAADHSIMAANPDVDRRRVSELVVRDSAERFRENPKRPFNAGQNVVYLSDFHSKRIAIRAGAGVGWVPRHLVVDDLERGELAVVPGDASSWTYAPVVIWPRDRPLRRAGTLFIETLRQANSV